MDEFEEQQQYAEALATQAKACEMVAENERLKANISNCVVLLHRMLEAPAGQVSIGWKNAIGPVLLTLKA